MNQPGEKKKRSQRRLWPIGVGCLAIIVIIVLGGVYLSQSIIKVFESSQINEQGEEARPIAEVVWGGRLPNGASDLHYFSYGGIDGKGYVRVSLPATTWNETYASNPLCATLDKTVSTNRFYGKVSKDWWTPNQDAPASLVIDGTCGGRNAYRLRLLLDTSNPDTYLLYMVAG
jgi:hypothetical protein